MLKFNLLRSTFWAIILCVSINARNPRRNVDPTIPTILVTSDDPEYHASWPHLFSAKHVCKSSYSLSHSFLRIKPILYGFDKDFFNQHLLPDGLIEFRKKNGFVHSDHLKTQLEELVEEIKQGSKNFSHFIKLKDKDFNYKTCSGLLVLKFKDYPFVVKISIEHPFTMVEPLSKSIEAYGIFVVGGNLRHLTNFTRIPNLHRIKKILSCNPFYLHNLDFPSKWYWKPEKTAMLQITWICNSSKRQVEMPNIYATVSDFIESEENLPTNELNRLSMKVAADTGFLIDPHSGNIIIEKESRKYILLDTEDFRMMVGLDKSMKSKRYSLWYLELLTNSLYIILFRPKDYRLYQTMYE